jgi:hypothetical protein
MHRVVQLLESQLTEHISFTEYVRSLSLGHTNWVSLIPDTYFANIIPASPKKTIITPAIQSLRKVPRHQNESGESPLQSRKTMAIVFNMIPFGTTVGEILETMAPISFKGIKRNNFHVSNKEPYVFKHDVFISGYDDVKLPGVVSPFNCERILGILKYWLGVKCELSLNSPIPNLLQPIVDTYVHEITLKSDGAIRTQTTLERIGAKPGTNLNELDFTRLSSKN